MRRTTSAAAVSLLLAGLLATAAPAVAADDRIDLTILATTDVHGRALDWDYFAEAPGDIPEEVVGLSRLATVIDDVREREGEAAVVVVDNGDAIQGTPLTEMYGVGAPEAADLPEHPMATAFNALGYDALTVGNHEFDYGLDLLHDYRGQLDGDLVAANVVVEATGEPLLDPYTLVHRTIDGEDVTVGVLGLATPALGTYQVEQMPGLRIDDIVAAAEHWVPIVAAEADIVVVLAHSGEGTTPDADYDRDAATEDAVGNLARLVPGIDVIVQGHTHRDAPEQIYTNPVGEPVLVTQPSYWARSVSEVSLSLVPDSNGWRLDWSAPNAPHVTAHYGHEADAPDQAFVTALTPAHEAALAYVARIYEDVAPSTELMRSRTSRYEDTPILDFVNRVQTDVVREALAGTDWADLPVLAQASPLTRTGVFPEGMVTTGHIDGLYIYANTLDAVLLTGAQLRDYLENSARYFAQVERGGRFDPATGTNAEGIGDYSYDALSGVRYAIDLSQDPGSRITGLAHPDGTPVAADDRFVLALNNFRHTGAGGYPHVADAPTLYTGDVDIRELLTAWARERGVIDPADFFVENWRLITEPLPEPTPTPEPTPEPTADPTAEPTSDSTPSPTPTPTRSAGPLAATGAVAGPGIAAAALLLLGGAALAAVRRRWA